MTSSARELRVFVSSTSVDLRDYRGVARNVILKMGWHPEMMENFGAIPTETVAACRERLGKCDLVLLLVAFRCGWVPSAEQGGNDTDSITALELAHARERGIPVLAMLANEDWPQRLTEQDDDKARKWIRDFRQRLNLPAEFFAYEEAAGAESERFPGFRTKVAAVLLAHRERVLAESDRPAGAAGGPDYFERARDGLREGTVVPFIGPGVYGDGSLSVPALIRALAGDGAHDEPNCLATAAEYRERYLKLRSELLKRLRNIIDEQSAAATTPAMYELIAQAPRPPLIVSATHDQLLERHLEQSGKSYAIVTHIVRSLDGEHDGKILLLRNGEEPRICLADRLDVAGADFVIYKPLGSPLLHDRLDPNLDLDTVVVTENDHLTFLGRLQNQHTQIPAHFSRLFQRRTLLFTGYGLDVWQYRLVMQVFQAIGRRGSESSTLAVRKPASTMEELAWQRLGADLIRLEPNDFARRAASSWARAGKP